MRSTTSKTPLQFLAAIAVLASAAGLSGCSVDATSENKSPSAEKTESAPADNSRKATIDPDTSKTEAPASDDTDSSDDAVGSRASYEASVTRTEDCSSGTVAISDPGTVIAIKGNCPTVSITGDGSVVLADSIDKLELKGTGAVVFTRKLGLEVTASGIGNVATWESGTPTVNDTGTGNTLKQGS